jgi:hypothetical protein
MSEASPVNVGRINGTGWPTIDELALFSGVPATDETLLSSLSGAIDYGSLTLGDRWTGDVSDSIHRACMDYAASIYTERIGRADVQIEGFLGSTPLSRYRRVLLANRFTAIA